MRELYTKIIAESELLQPALNEIHSFAFNIGPAAAVPAGPAPSPLESRYVPCGLAPLLARL